MDSRPSAYLRRMLAAAATAVLGIVLLVPGTAAAAGTGAITGYGGKCVDVSGANTANGTKVQLWTCNGTNAQNWTVGTDGTIRALGKCLDVSGGSTSDGAKVQIWDCNGTGAQQWVATAAHDIVNPQANKCLDATGVSSADGTPLQIWTCSGGANQKWNVPGGTSGGGGSGVMAAPYYYTGWGNPPSIGTVMSATGIKQVTMAFMLSGGGCVPMWDGSRPLTGGADQATINTVRSNGGDVEISFGGYSGNKLGPNCSSASALAGAYQQVINAYGLKYIDIDVENTDEFENATVQDRILGALKIVKQNNPGIKTILTFGTSTTGPTYWGTRLINQAAALGANVDVFTIMPFDFGGGADMYGNTVNAANGLKNQLKTAFGWSDAQAYAHVGISGMNGYSDQSEVTTTAIWTSIRNWANTNHIARLAFWSINRDRGCAGGGVQESCSGISQSDWAFTQITAGFTG
ncbi:ricin-type beta-trefoil lectin domain protein [Dactylosporangium sp. NPDC049140]|uniref:ricin-type beta-trefoil lectin domain protein n=1 Tax=Dactylosporangium sp. NPDC049140 TaxID=3155647 RepID=UPI0034040185